MRALIRILLLVSLIVNQLFCQEDINKKITPKSIGTIELCGNINDVNFPCIEDTMFSGDGHYFYGKYYITAISRILVVISISDSTTITEIKIDSDYYETQNGIKVGSSLNDLISASKELQITVTMSNGGDLFFLEKFENSRIEYRFDKKAEEELYKLPLRDSNTEVNDIVGMSEMIEKIGKSARIKNISIVNTGMIGK